MTESISALQRLKAASSRKELAYLLGYKPSTLTSIVYKTPLDAKYIEFEIPKKDGSNRIIKAPTEKLKLLQSRLADLLYDCLEEIENSRNNKSVSHGFRRSQNIMTNAKVHRRRRFVLNIDLKDFFPSFHFGRVRGFFLKDKCFELNEQVATTIAQIACDGQALPQGSPCSPIISELIGQVLDLRLLRFAKKHRVSYSRYADDLTFSTNQKQFPKFIATQNSNELSEWTLAPDLVDKINHTGFEINDAKTRMSVRGSRQSVTSLVVNEKVNIASDYYRKARAMCDTLFQTGQYYKGVQSSACDAENGDDGSEYIKNLEPLEGILNHIYYVTQGEEKRDSRMQNDEPRAIRKLYRRFLFYKNCVALETPLIVTEGKTDPIYLKSAIRSLSENYPILGSKQEKGFKFGVRFFNHESKSAEIMDVKGGSSSLISIVLDYKKNFPPYQKKFSWGRPFKHAPLKQPVILVLDNDDGLKAVRIQIKKHYGVDFDKTTTADFYPIAHNLYVVKTPENLKPNNESCIEDLFPQELLKTKVKNKTFNIKSKINPEKEYGKEIFAKRVVKPNASKIDFSGFDPLLTRIVKTIVHHNA